jgi:undecaprenyl-diphosphatase
MRRVKTRLLTYWENAGGNEMMFLGGILAFCLCVWLFLSVAGWVTHGSFQQAEVHWMRALRNPADPSRLIGPWWFVGVVRDVSALGSAVVVIMLSVFCTGYFLLRQQWGHAAFLAVTVLGGYVLNQALKSNYSRVRPEVVPHLAEVSSASFPSGHSMVSSLVYLTLGALLAQTAPRRREKIYSMAAAALLTLLIGVSRVALGVHYPTDVLAGWSAGTAWALACLLIAWRWQQVGNKRRLRTELEQEHAKGR